MKTIKLNDFGHEELNEDGQIQHVFVKIKCDCCKDDAVIKDYRNDLSVVVCEKHLNCSDRQFWLAWKRNRKNENA